MGQFNIAPVLDFERDSNLDTPYNYQNRRAHDPKIEVDRNFNPFQKGNNLSTAQKKSFRRATAGQWDSLYVGLESKENGNQTNFSQVEFESQPESTALFDKGSQLKSHQTTYQLHNKYIISTIKSGMMILDQHRAHQRILYEGFLKSMTVREAVSQQLLFPLHLKFSAAEMNLLINLKEDLEHTGFIFTNFCEENVEITGVPINVSESEVETIIERLLGDIEQEVPDANFSASDLLAKSMAKSLAIKTGQNMTVEEQEHLVNSLFACKEPSVAPDNRVTFITMSVADFDKKFV